MKRLLASLVASLLLAASPSPHWTLPQAQRLVEWLNSAADDGLRPVSIDTAGVKAAITTGEGSALDKSATAAAVHLLTAYRQGCCNASLRSGWHITTTPAWPDAADTVNTALASNQLDQMFEAARPSHPFYYSLRKAYARERDPTRRETLAANLDRWRWMPRALGERYLLVNTAAFEASLWDGRNMVGRWRVVVGKTKSPTPIFATRVTGVIFNPWWEIPPAIAAEGVAAMVRKRPAEAARKGYVLQNGRYRQRPGATNALGRMKLVMPNGFNVYLHDTPTQNLFAQDVRAYSHGCVRVGDALDLATTLLAVQPQWDRSRVDALAASGRTERVALATPIPVYVTYFTAEPDGNGGIRYFPDIYHRDRGASAPDDNGKCTR